MADDTESLTWSMPQRVLLVVAIGLLLLLLWRLANVVILVFGGVVFAVALRGLGLQLNRHLKVPERAAVPLAALSVLAALVLAAWLLGDQLGQQVALLRERLPQAWAAAREWLNQNGLGRQLLDVLNSAGGTFITGERLAGAATLTLGALGSAVLVLIVAVYLAIEPGVYRAGLVRLMPPSQRARVDAALGDSGQALGRWLMGQGFTMVFLGAATALGLGLLGIPFALALGLITGLLAFVPFFGAITAGVLSVLLAFTEGPRAALHVALLFLAIQQVEEYLLAPFVQRWAVALPPVLTLMAALIFAPLFGPMGVVFATPLLVVATVLIKRLYVEDVLETPPGRQPIIEQATPGSGPV